MTCTCLGVWAAATQRLPWSFAVTAHLPPRTSRPWKLEGPSTNFFASLLSGTGTWQKSTVGKLDPGLKDMWGVLFQGPDKAVSPRESERQQTSLRPDLHAGRPGQRTCGAVAEEAMTMNREQSV